MKKSQARCYWFRSVKGRWRFRGGHRMLPRQMAGHVVLARKDHRAERAAEARSLSAFESGVAVAIVASRIAATAAGATVLGSLSLGFHFRFRVIRLRIFHPHCKEKTHRERKQQCVSLYIVCCSNTSSVPALISSRLIRSISSHFDEKIST